MAESITVNVLDAFQRGDERAFSAIFERFYPRLVAYSFKITRSELQSQEIASESLYKVFKRHENFRTAEQMERFIFVVTRNASLDYLRYLKNFTSSHQSYLQTQEIGEEEWLDVQLDGALLERLYQAIEELPERSKNVIKLLYIEQLPYKKIAEKMETTIKNIENLKCYAIKKLRKDFVKEAGDFAMLMAAIFCLVQF